MHDEHELRRPLERSLVGGVCAGLAAYLGVSTLLVRALFAVIAVFSGIGVMLYPVAWALIPARGQRPGTWRERFGRWREAVAVGLLALAAGLALRRLGLWLGDVVVLPLVAVSIGVALILRQALVTDDAGPAAWRPRMPWRRWPAGALGIVIVLGAAVVFLNDTGFLTAHGRRPAIEAGVIVVVFSLLVGPYLFGLAQRLSRERAQRVRTEERAEMAAHLHDSVLQTLALIQRRAADPAQVTALARRQERELRDWLLARDGLSVEPGSLRAAIERIAHDIEADHGVRVETVLVGDCALDEPVRALAAAAREAVLNAAKFAAAPQIDIYAEAGEGSIEVFVRDRGAGFDPEHIPDDRQGIRRSIRERMARHHGTAVIRSAPGEGTEVELRLERARA